MISVINPEDAVVMLPAAVGAAVLDHKHLGAGLQITMHIVNQDKLPKIMCLMPKGGLVHIPSRAGKVNSRKL